MTNTAIRKMQIRTYVEAGDWVGLEALWKRDPEAYALYRQEAYVTTTSAPSSAPEGRITLQKSALDAEIEAECRKLGGLTRDTLSAVFRQRPDLYARYTKAHRQR
jgi:hypothetical protein